jgi:hypothetical protein
MTKGGEQPSDLVAGQRDEAGWWWVLGVFVGGDDGEQCVGEHRQQGPRQPRQPAAELVLVEPGQALASLKGLLHGPAASGDSDSCRGTGVGA